MLYDTRVEAIQGIVRAQEKKLDRFALAHELRMDRLEQVMVNLPWLIGYTNMDREEINLFGDLP